MRPLEIRVLLLHLPRVTRGLVRGKGRAIWPAVFATRSLGALVGH